MSQVLRQSTQVIVVIGPFVDVGDGFTPETGIDLSTADEAEILKANTTTTTSIAAATWAAITGCDGYYGLTLTTSLTDTVGPLTVMVNDDSVCLPVFARFQVIEEAAYDAIYAASAAPATAAGVSAVETDTQDIQSRLPAALVSGRIDASVGAMAANVLTATAINADAITAAKVAADVSAEIADAVWDESATGHTDAGKAGEQLWTDLDAVLVDTAEIGAAGAGLTVLATQASVNTIDDFLDTEVAAILAAVDTEVAAILADTNELQTDWADGGRLDLILDARASQTSVDTIDGIVDAILVDTAEIGAAGAGLTALSTQASVNTVDTVVDAIKAKTDSLTFTVAGQVDSNIQSVNDVTVAGTGAGGDEWGPA